MNNDENFDSDGNLLVHSDIAEVPVQPTKKPRLNRQAPNSTNQCTSSSPSNYTLRPDQFKVLLCVDNAEVIGGVVG